MQSYKASLNTLGHISKEPLDLRMLNEPEPNKKALIHKGKYYSPVNRLVQSNKGN